MPRKTKKVISDLPTRNILAIDPSGTTITGFILYHSWSSYKIFSFESDNWLEHVDKIREILENEEVKLIVYEESRFLKHRFMSFHFRHLLFANAGILLLNHWLGTKVITNTSSNIKTHLQPEEIPGLSREKRKSLNSKRERLTWIFRGQEINEHEKDAVLHLYWHMVRREKLEWPWIEK